MATQGERDPFACFGRDADGRGCGRIQWRCGDYVVDGPPARKSGPWPDERQFVEWTCTACGWVAARGQPMANRLDGLPIAGNPELKAFIGTVLHIE